MSHVRMLSIEDLKQTRLAPLIDRALAMGAPDPGFFAIMGHNIVLAEAAFECVEKILAGGALSAEVKEILRVKLARLAACNY